MAEPTTAPPQGATLIATTPTRWQEREFLVFALALAAYVILSARPGADPEMLDFLEKAVLGTGVGFQVSRGLAKWPA